MIRETRSPQIALGEVESSSDIAFVLGANDVVNPLAEEKGSPIYTMMVFGDAKKVVEDIVKAIE